MRRFFVSILVVLCVSAVVFADVNENVGRTATLHFDLGKSVTSLEKIAAFRLQVDVLTGIVKNDSTLALFVCSGADGHRFVGVDSATSDSLNYELAKDRLGLGIAYVLWTGATDDMIFDALAETFGNKGEEYRFVTIQIVERELDKIPGYYSNPDDTGVVIEQDAPVDTMAKVPDTTHIVLSAKGDPVFRLGTGYHAWGHAYSFVGVRLAGDSLVNAGAEFSIETDDNLGGHRASSIGMQFFAKPFSSSEFEAIWGVYKLHGKDSQFTGMKFGGRIKQQVLFEGFHAFIEAAWTPGNDEGPKETHWDWGARSLYLGVFWQTGK